MSHNTDGLYSSKRTAVIRASDDFWPRVTASHTVHIASVAYNTIFLGEFMQLDWDMFHSLHPMAEYHGAARAVGGCAIYVSDKPGHHDFNLLKKLVLPDGSILRAKLPGRPSRYCLFTDPTRDGTSLLRIWNLNNFSGVVGVFNCQGAGWCKYGKKILTHDERPATITGVIRAKDVNYLPRVQILLGMEMQLYTVMLVDLLQFLDGSPNDHHFNLSHKRPRENSHASPPKIQDEMDEDDEEMRVARELSMGTMKDNSESSLKDSGAIEEKEKLTYPPLPEEPKCDRNLVC